MRRSTVLSLPPELVFHANKVNDKSTSKCSHYWYMLMTWFLRIEQCVLYTNAGNNSLKLPQVSN
jgi:hypothetical protein